MVALFVAFLVPVVEVVQIVVVVATVLVKFLVEAIFEVQNKQEIVEVAHTLVETLVAEAEGMTSDIEGKQMQRKGLGPGILHHTEVAQ